ncbi:uncharacterized protein LOC113769211 [Coffea eugenioides]|uniref:Uncharacterized mitochondrial protein AtMg00310-like n=1 Tax=Coffea arabica TaxID=13443 RepID=A0ABM4VUH7_COFAR|nr:uncharacterized protein LOC113758014 [Coffea eugenioides]XP_027169478.1 uncharacterized protein LOC113769211 [Coffea eugenioides]
MAMTTYAMSCFKLSSKLCKYISSRMARFWWGEKDGKSKLHWCSWKKLAQEKENGGLGFKDLLRFNRALLGKQSIMGAREEVEEGIRRKIGNGRSTMVWDDKGGGKGESRSIR